MVHPSQAAAEAGYHLAHRPAGHFGHQLAGKVIALHAGDRKDLALLIRQALDAICDRCLHTGGQAAPVQRLTGRPTPRLVLEQLPARLQVAQQLYGEQRVPAGLRVQRIPEA